MPNNAKSKSYAGRHAKFYDLFYGDKPYDEEALFVHECIQKNGAGKNQFLLELACGTGNHALALNKLGYKIIATDYSEDMLAHAQKKINGSSGLEFLLQDMRQLDIPEKSFDVAICLFDSIGYVATNESLLKTLRTIHDHIRPGGLFIFEFWHAAPMLSDYDPIRIRKWQTPEGEILRISETELNYAEQLGKVTYTIYDHRKDGTYSKIKEIQLNRYFLVQEMAFFLTVSGFMPIKWYNGFTFNENINKDTWHIVSMAKRI